LASCVRAYLIVHSSGTLLNECRSLQHGYLHLPWLFAPPLYVVLLCVTAPTCTLCRLREQVAARQALLESLQVEVSELTSRVGGWRTPGHI
jgi:hypothetical protein